MCLFLPVCEAKDEKVPNFTKILTDDLHFWSENFLEKTASSNNLDFLANNVSAKARIHYEF